MLEATRLGALPRVAPDGRTSIRAYGRAFPRAEKRPRIAIVVGGLGLNAALSDEAIRRLQYDEKVLMLGCGKRSLRVRPPLTVERDALDRAVDAIDRVLTAMEA